MRLSSCQRQIHAATMAKNVGDQNEDKLLGRSQVRVRGRMVDEGEVEAVTFDGEETVDGGRRSKTKRNIRKRTKKHDRSYVQQ